MTCYLKYNLVPVRDHIFVGPPVTLFYLWLLVCLSHMYICGCDALWTKCVICYVWVYGHHGCFCNDMWTMVSGSICDIVCCICVCVCTLTCFPYAECWCILACVPVGRVPCVCLWEPEGPVQRELGKLCIRGFKQASGWPGSSPPLSASANTAYQTGWVFIHVETVL